jgi:Interferon-induced transmembrane protein
MTQPPPPGYPPQQPSAGQAPSNHLVLSIIALLLCTIPGIFAVVKSSQVNGLWAQGQYAEAQASADTAKKVATWSIIAGVVLYIVVIILNLVVVGASNSNAAMFAVMF